MARQLTTDPQIDAFIQKVIVEAGHHAVAVQQVIFPLSQAVRSRLTLGIDKVEVYEKNGQIARTCWVTFAGPPWRRWAFSYNYKQQKIDLRRHSVQGPTVFQFDNTTSAAAIATQVALL